MLRNKPRAAVTKKQQASSSLMADQPPVPVPPPSSSSSKLNNTCHSSSSLFSSPKFRFFASKMTPPFDSDFSLVSPTSILEANPSFFSSKNTKPTTYFEPTIPNPQRFHPPDTFGLADLVKYGDSNRDHSSKPVNKMVLFGSKLRVQIPSADFGTKTGMRYPAHGHGQGQGQLSPCVQAKKVLAVSEVDQTEDYTRVISHGPNPTITHIFDNSVFVEATPCSVSLPPPLVAMAMDTTKNT
ncbi:PREDICTED: protein MARD1-like isoform X2 [Camelina sativa]|uniref:Protein MARD1-like isoform X1 n=1 Tax=Camelina sativa TaxID=90675 RepID=A0ABM1Q7T8_CAMSA|nr:PREDICTED: protein MARD1-like isoform X1 [Camelina sativa]XP_019082827.1 PREDICTED: protein MARD1-like isoform X2 [Camelina sativa]